MAAAEASRARRGESRIACLIGAGTRPDAAKCLRTGSFFAAARTCPTPNLVPGHEDTHGGPDSASAAASARSGFSPPGRSGRSSASGELEVGRPQLPADARPLPLVRLGRLRRSAARYKLLGFAYFVVSH